SDRQAQAILEMQLQRLTSLEVDKIEKEYLELIKRIEMLKGILANEKKILAIIKDEIAELKNKFGDDRRTEIVGEFKDLDVEDLIAEEDMVITISHAGYIRRLPVSAYRKQKRGGKGVTGTGTRDEDFVEHLFIASTHEFILFFTDSGKVYCLKVYEIPQVGRLAKGSAIINILSLGGGEKITSFVPVKEFVADRFLVMATRKGSIKKVELEAFKNTRKGGIIAITLEEGDKLIGTALTDGNREILIATRQGIAIRFNEKDIRDMGRGAKGVIGIRLDKKDEVIAMEVVAKDGTLLTVTEKGFGKRTSFEEYRLQSRGGKGIINIKITDKNGTVVGLKSIKESDDIMIITQQGMVVRSAVKEIRVIGRSTQGVRVIKLNDKDRVASVASIITEEEDEEPGSLSSSLA
ncbi:MAG: DNA gyrase C-terminal beta-propeller domain-containing protein, partial [Candidatus Omnitrophica bacterium]|nr:DNA gyrase C-terminal beta-propeller domain-containing protein [Candidatus Omnitrophota bacterium]